MMHDTVLWACRWINEPTNEVNR